MRYAFACILAAALAALLAAAPAAAETYYVAAGGDDGNPGTEAAPWASIQHAADTRWSRATR